MSRSPEGTIVRQCRLLNQSFEISPLEQELCRKLQLPLPTICPEERMRRLCAGTNYTNLFQGTCALTGQKILQSFRPGGKFPVYETQAWWSDAWDPLSFGRPYDFARPFFQQFLALRNAVPQPALSVTTSTVENCDYVNGVSFCKNCYLVFSGYYSEDCYFCFGACRSKDCIDCNAVYDCELCYDCCHLLGCYDVRHAFNSRNCRESAFIWNCVGCSECFACCNLRQASFCFFNEQLAEDEYHARVAAVQWDNYEKIERLKAEFRRFLKTQPQPSVRGLEFEESSGDFLNNCKNVQHCFYVKELEDAVNCVNVEQSRDCLDMFGFGVNCELIGRSVRAGYDTSNIRMCILAYLGAADLDYCIMCPGCKHCFGCVGLTRKEYCILNKEYKAAEYSELRKRIINQMEEHGRINPDLGYGEMFPYRLLLNAYNDSDAQIFFPLSRSDALRRGAHWEEEQEEATAVPMFQNFPVRTADVPGPTLEGVFYCIETGKPFRITKQELNCYRNRRIPIPRKHWKTRLLERKALRNGPVLYDQQCAKTGKGIHSSFPPGDGWLVYDYPEYLQLFS